MGNPVIAIPNISDAATITAGSAAGSMPVTNLQTQQPSQPWRATDLNNSYIVVDLGSAQAINLIALLYTNASQAATIRYRAATSIPNLTASPSYDSGAVSHMPNPNVTWFQRTHAFKWFGSSTKTFRYWRIDISDTGNGNGYYQAGRLYMDLAWQPLRGAKYGGTIEIKEPVSRLVAGGGQRYPAVRTKTQAQKFTFEYLSQTEMLTTSHKINYLRGLSLDVLLILNPDDSTNFMQQTIYGLLEPGGVITYSAATPSNGLPLYSQTIQIEELP
jgi:hypothetical protein